MPWSSVGGLWQLGRGSPAPLGRRAAALHRSPLSWEAPARPCWGPALTHPPTHPLIHPPTHPLLPTPSRRVLLGPPQQGAAGLVRRGATPVAAPPCALAWPAAPRRPVQAARNAAARLLAVLRSLALPAALTRPAPHPAAPPSPQFLLGIRQRRPPDAGPDWRQKWVTFVKARAGGTLPCCNRLGGQGGEGWSGPRRRRARQLIGAAAPALPRLPHPPACALARLPAPLHPPQVGSGLTDSQLEWLHDQLKGNVTPHPPPCYE